MSTIDLDALERTAQAATPGPWDIEYDVEHYDYGPSERWPSTLIGPRRNPPGVLAEKYGNRINEIAELRDEDAEHIAAFDPPTALALIARVRELEAIVNDGGNQAAKHWTRLNAAERALEAERANVKRAQAEARAAELRDIADAFLDQAFMGWPHNVDVREAAEHFEGMALKRADRIESEVPGV